MNYLIACIAAVLAACADGQIFFNRSIPRLAEQTGMVVNSLSEDSHEAEHHVYANEKLYAPPRQARAASLRGLGISDRSTAVETIANKSIPQLIDDFGELDELEAPDIWDILIWIGAWIGRVTRTVIVGIIKLSYALYTGMAYGWESAKPADGEGL